MHRILILPLLVFVFISCNEKTDLQTDSVSHGPDSAPSSWMYNQRAFPNGINKTIKQEALKQYLSMPSSGDSRYDKPWDAVGPTNIGGRFTDVSLDPTNMNVIYAGSAVGGVWKSEDKGHNWSLVFEEPGGVSIGNVEVSPTNPDVVYVGTGEANGSATSGAFFGNGIYKSIDAGATWTNVGLPNSDHIGRIIFHPTNEDIVYVAVAGKLYGKNLERGLYKTENGGQTWEQKLFINDSTAVIDVAMSAAQPEVLFASSWERTRFAEGRVYGGFSSGIHRSLDGGNTWELLTNGLPINEGDIGRIGLAVSQTNPNVVYASFTNDVVINRFLGVYKSEDQGDTWIELNGEELGGVFSSFGWYFGNLRINPTNNEELYILGLRTMRSFDGDIWDNWSSGIHVDQHGLEFHPQDPNYRVVANDGGIYITEDAGENFRHIQTIDNNQFYECAIHPTLPETYLAGAQDNGTVLKVADGVAGYVKISGGDGFGIQFDKVNPEIFYVTSQNGALRRATSLEPFTSEFIRPDLEIASRRNWNTPFVTIPNELGGILYGAEHVLMSQDTGTTWQVISPDLTNGPYEGSGFGTITCLAISNINPDIIIAGTNDGNLQITTDRGINWNLISDELPLLEVSSVATDPNDEATIYVTFSGYRSNDYLPHVLRSTDYGESWMDISANLPETPINEIVIDPSLPDHYYLATDLGVFFTSNGGESWQILGSDLPATIVADLDLHDEQRLLLAGTYGRSMYTYELPSEVLSAKGDNTDNLIRIYPNPTASLLNIDYNQLTNIKSININNNAGAVIRAIASNSTSIDVSDLNSGIYNLRIVTDEEIIVRRFIKQ